MQRAGWWETYTAVREALYEARRPLTVAEIVEWTGCAETTVRGDLRILRQQGRVVRLVGNPSRHLHVFWHRAQRQPLRTESRRASGAA